MPPSGEYFFHSFENFFLNRLVFDFERRRQLRHQILLLACQLRRHDHINRDVKIASSGSASFRNASSFDAKLRTGLRARWDAQLLVFTIDGGNRKLRAERGLRKGDRNVAKQIMLAALEKLVLLNAQHDVKVSGRTAVSAGIAFSGDSQLRAGVDARWNFQFEILLTDDASIAAASATAILDHLAGALAVVASASNAEEALLHADLAVAVTRRASGRAGAFLRAAPVAFAACLVVWNLDFFGDAERGLFERQLHLVSKIGAAMNASSSAPAAAAEKISEAEKVA